MWLNGTLMSPHPGIHLANHRNGRGYSEDLRHAVD